MPNSANPGIRLTKEYRPYRSHRTDKPDYNREYELDLQGNGSGSATVARARFEEGRKRGEELMSGGATITTLVLEIPLTGTRTVEEQIACLDGLKRTLEEVQGPTHGDQEDTDR
jgi:hypothetical protein